MMLSKAKKFGLALAGALALLLGAAGGAQAQAVRVKNNSSVYVQFSVSVYNRPDVGMGLNPGQEWVAPQGVSPRIAYYTPVGSFRDANEAFNRNTLQYLRDRFVTEYSFYDLPAGGVALTGP